MLNLQKFIRAIPAGREINVLTTGRTLEKNVMLSPYFLNHFSDLSNSCSLINKYFPNFLISPITTCFSPHHPSQNASHDPKRLAKAPTKITIERLNLPVVARYPANVMVTSEGIGINADSAAIRKKIPKYPLVEITDIIRFVK